MILFALQPLMDILSYWMAQLELSNTPTLLLRLAVLGVVGVLGFCTSTRKRYYFIAIALCAALAVGHIASCLAVGYQDPVGDLTNLIRVLQMPLFVFAMVSFLRANEDCYGALEKGFQLNFWIITASILLAVVTGTASPTYELKNLGILGWFSTSNAQSAIMSLLTPIVVLLALRRGKKPLFVLTVAAGYVQLYFLGTRLAFLAIAVTTVGTVLTLLLTRKWNWFYALVVVAGLLLCVACVKVSPMYQNQNVYNEAMSSKQKDANTMLQWAEEALEESGEVEEEEGLTEAQQREILKTIYEFYSSDLCERFGVEKVMEKYDYSSTISEMTALRHKKIVYCELLMDEQPFSARIFGMELSRMTWNNYTYDVENDFHGIYFLYGGVGLAMMIAFLAYFLIQIIRCLMKDFKRYFTLEAAAVGMALCLALVYAYCTAGVLRRPNSSYYLSMILAAVYYLVKMRGEQPDGEERKSL
jgi:hypothetical protein